MRVEAFGVRRSRLCGDVFGILEGSRPRQLTVEIAPSFGFGGCECRVRACIRFSRRHRADDTEGWRRSATLPPEVGIYLYLNMTRSTTGLVAKPKNKIAAVQTRLMRLPLQIVHCRAETALRVPADCLLLNARSRNCELLQH